MHREDLKIVLRDLGLVVPTVGFMAALSLPVVAYFGEWFALWPFALTALAAFGLGGLLYLPFRRAGEARLKHGLLIAAMGWLLVAAVGALPFHFVSLRLGGGTLYPYADMANAFFESVSGFTGTGLTMSLRPDLLPHSLQWWRSFTEWIGGMGVIVLMLTLIAGPGASAVSLYFAEARGEKIHPSVVSTVRTMWWIFALYTFAAAVALWGAGMPPWEAVNHAMTGLSTGGFSVWPDSIGHYGSLAIELILLVVMTAGAVSFAVHYQAMQRGLRAFWRDVQTRWLIALLLAGVALLGLENLSVYGLGQAYRTAAFQYVSAMTCTGFGTVNLAGWTDGGKLLLALAMVLGGAAGSTAGGIKVIRLVLLAKGVSWRFRKIVSPATALVPLRLGGTVLSEGEASRRLEEAAVLAFLWLGFLGLGIAVLLHTVPDSFKLADVIFEVASAQGNVGLSTGITHPEMATLAKLSLSFNMWVGRLEIIPVLMLIRAILRRGE
jgi:trk system potassium uptake protein TrkH